jgi:uncharacterized protein YjbJ (UPF0337 family)
LANSEDAARIASLATLPLLGCLQEGGARSAAWCVHKHRGAVMNKDQIQGNWKQLKGKVKEQWGKLTDNDLTEIEGNMDQLAGRVQERYGIQRDEADRQIKEFRRRNEDLWP